MNFCEKCNFASEQEFCPVCGSEKLREVKDDDFCFLADSEISPCEAMTDIFDEEGIAYVKVPYGTGSRLALPQSRYRLYFQYRSLELVKRIVRDVVDNEKERLRQILLENQDKLHLDPKKEKKIAKKLKFSEAGDIYSFCVNVVKSSEDIVDEGRITGCPKGGHYIFCYAENAILTVNSQTYEILSLKTS